MRAIWNLLGRAIGATLSPVMKAAAPYRKPRTRVLVCDESGNILLVKSWLGSQKWALPGGGVKSGEKLEDAAKREVHEETGIKVNKIRYHGTIDFKDAPIGFSASVFVAEAVGLKPKLKPQAVEIVEAMWFDIHDLPDTGVLVNLILGQVDL